MSADWESELKHIYKTPGESGAFSSVDKLFRALHDKGYSVSRIKIKEWLNDNYTYTIHKARKLNFPRNPIFASHIDQNWQADILFLPELQNYNRKFICVLVCIDVVSRYAWGKPMRTKKGFETAKAFKNILEESGRKPEKLQTDKGSEFYNKDFKAVLQKNNIKLYSTESDKKAAIAERCIKEIKKLIYRYLTYNHTNEYVKILPSFFETYNKTFHSSIKMSPAEVSDNNEGVVLRNLYGHLWSEDIIPAVENVEKNKKKRQFFFIGDKVRIASGYKPFSKGYKGFWTTEVYIIDNVKKYFPFMKYKLKSVAGEKLKGLFYSQQLQRVTPKSNRFTDVEIVKRKIIRGKQWVLVKWKNEASSLKRWILRSQLH